MRQQFEQSIEKAKAAVANLDFSDRQVYALWLSQAYFIVRHSTPLLALSCARAIENRAYHLRCIGHLSEEKGHDKLILNDLRQMNLKIDDFKELSSTQALYQTQYYWIEHQNPVSLMGYILILEGLAVTMGREKLRQVNDPRISSFIKLHSDEDIGHLKIAYEQIEKMGLADQECIARNAELSANLYTYMVAEITDRAKLLVRLVS